MSPHEIDLMASALFRIVERPRLWLLATIEEKENYRAVCRQTVESVQLEQRQQQPEDGRKEVA